MNIQSLKINKYFWFLTTIIVGTLILCFRLTSSGLWYDECVEYYFSKYMTGTTPGFPELSNMYERICFTGQPPLYNIFMWFWLKFSNTETWFRFAGVVTTLFGALAVFNLCKETSYPTASISTLIYITSFPTRYFALECAEYNLLAANLVWMLYFFYRYLKDNHRKFFYGFLLFAILSIYSQYGAVFVVGGCGIVILFKVLFFQKTDLFYVFISGISSLLLAILPLVYYFLIPQMENQGSKKADHSLAISFALLPDFLKSISDTFSYFFLKDLPFLGKIIMICIAIILIIIGFFVCIHKNNKTYGDAYVGTMIALFISYLIYYLAVKMNFYGMVFVGGSFGNHWALAIGVFLIVSAIFLLFYLSKEKKVLCYLLCSLLVGTNLFSLFTVNWQKDNIREIVNENHLTITQSPIYLSYTEIIPFSYYTKDESGINPHTFGKWTYHCENLSEKKVKEKLKQDLGPSTDEFYLLIGSEDSPKTMIQALSDMGYEAKKISSNESMENNMADMSMTSYLYYIHQ